MSHRSINKFPIDVCRLCNTIIRARDADLNLHKVVSLSLQSRYQSTLELLVPPTIIYADNHLLAVDKYPGWHAVPNKNDESKEKNDDEKCLLTYLQNQKLGGGSRKDFLKPLHRIDQPCSGVLLLAKTTKAATRITQAWKQKLVQKTYLCLVQPEHIGALIQNSSELERDWFELHGYYEGKTRPDLGKSSPPVGWSVRLSPTPKNHRPDRKLTLRWKRLTKSVLLIKTEEGARHMVRALLSQIGKAPLLGDIRYESNIALHDRSVALHARSVTLPDELKLGTTEQRIFIAPIPLNWKSFAGISEKDIVEQIENESGS